MAQEEELLEELFRVAGEVGAHAAQFQGWEALGDRADGSALTPHHS